MKPTALVTAVLIGAFATVEAKRYWHRLQFTDPLNWYPKSSLIEKRKIKDITGGYDEWSSEDWAANVLMTCKYTDGCNSCIAYQGKLDFIWSRVTLPTLTSKSATDERTRDKVWWGGILLSARTEEKDYERNPKYISSSIGYSVFLGGGTQPSANEDEQVVFDV